MKPLGLNSYCMVSTTVTSNLIVTASKHPFDFKLLHSLYCTVVTSNLFSLWYGNKGLPYMTWTIIAYNVYVGSTAVLNFNPQHSTFIKAWVRLNDPHYLSFRRSTHSSVFVTQVCWRVRFAWKKKKRERRSIIDQIRIIIRLNWHAASDFPSVVWKFVYIDLDGRNTKMMWKKWTLQWENCGR